ncbi:hypothetical protein F4561_005950 [Lipingzhangella halophila]|uniref:Uncharacterized protein n=1 Tax=Lipingzhangella halophila TaxID=1783352 RepID=A0A7W7W5R6_9ACTN|nr:hypothetical protein [Lipingzhangella halophila]MBB4935056.1 hypothetical protein [Lipingzhangella halophila]
MATSAVLLPLYALDLARRYWAPLLCVYVAGTALHALALRGVAKLGQQDEIFGMVGVSVSLLVTLATTIIMFHMLRPGLPTLDQELSERSARARRGTPQAPGQVSVNERERRLVDAIAMAILPFLAFYSAWGLVGEEFQSYALQVYNDAGPEAYAFVSDFDRVGAPLIVALGAFCVRAGVEALYNRTESKILGLLTALLEAIWVFFAIVTVSPLLSDARAWFGERVVWAEIQSLYTDGLIWLSDVTSIPVLTLASSIAGTVAWVWNLLKDGLVEPLLWLTIAAVVFGADVDRTETLFRGQRRVERLHRTAMEHTPGMVARVTSVVGGTYRDKYVPFVNALRFILSVSPAYYLSFCLYYALLELGFGWLERGVFIAVGPEDFLSWWWPWLTPIEFVVEGLHEFFRVCLLAAAFELTLRRGGGRTSGRRRAPRRADHFGM